MAALLLAAFGVYAVAALRQKQRTAELGLRLAIGASPGALAIQVLGDSARSAAIGLALGVLGAWMALRVLASQLFGLEGAGVGIAHDGDNDIESLPGCIKNAFQGL